MWIRISSVVFLPHFYFSHCSSLECLVGHSLIRDIFEQHTHTHYKSNLMCYSNKYERWTCISLSVWDQLCQWGSRGWRRKLIQALLCLHESQWSEGIREALTPYICWRVRFGILPHQATPEACRGFTLCFVQNGFLRLHFVITKTVSPVCAICHGCLSRQPLLPGDCNKCRTVANWRILHEN